MYHSLTLFQLFRRIWLIILVWFLLGIFQLLIKLLPFKIYAKRLEQQVVYAKLPPANLIKPLNKLGQAKLIGRIVAITSNYTLWPSKCLVQAITTKFLLRCFRITNTLIIGVAFNAENKFIAHAWVEVSGVIVVGGTTSPEQFKRLKTFSDNYY